jgi:hypothetical protein
MSKPIENEKTKEIRKAKVKRTFWMLKWLGIMFLALILSGVIPYFTLQIAANSSPNLAKSVTFPVWKLQWLEEVSALLGAGCVLCLGIFLYWVYKIDKLNLEQRDERLHIEVKNQLDKQFEDLQKDLDELEELQKQFPKGAKRAREKVEAEKKKEKEETEEEE